ncbi:hypothetical protein [Streptomyces sp. NPDC004270]
MTAKIFLSTIATGAFLTILGVGAASEAIHSGSAQSSVCTSQCAIVADSGWQVTVPSTPSSDSAH